MELLVHGKRLSGDQKGSPGSKVITSEVPDRPKRTSVKGKSKPLTTAPESDFTLQENDGNIDPVDTDPLGLDVQAHELTQKTQENVRNEEELFNLHADPITLASLTSGIHEAKEILDLINLIKSTGQQDADGLDHRFGLPLVTSSPG
jgi:hypothetical protein